MTLYLTYLAIILIVIEGNKVIARNVTKHMLTVTNALLSRPNAMSVAMKATLHVVVLIKPRAVTKLIIKIVVTIQILLVNDLIVNFQVINRDCTQ